MWYSFLNVKIHLIPCLIIEAREQDNKIARSEKMIVVYFKGDFYAYEYEGKTLAQVIRDYGLNRKMIREWYKK